MPSVAAPESQWLRPISMAHDTEKLKWVEVRLHIKRHTCSPYSAHFERRASCPFHATGCSRYNHSLNVFHAVVITAKNAMQLWIPSELCDSKWMRWSHDENTQEIPYAGAYSFSKRSSRQTMQRARTPVLSISLQIFKQCGIRGYFPYRPCSV